MSLSIRGVSYYSEYDYDDISYYVGDLYDWLEDSHPRRGDIKIELTSPQGTKSILLPYRNYDFINAEGYDDWPFMSVHFWGEDPIGAWTLKITYKSGSGYVRMSGLSMTLYGTATIPTAVSSIPSVCHSSCARGCFGEGPEHCDSCQHFRIASTLECVDQCPTHTHAYKSYCYADERSTTTSPTVTDEGQSATNPHGSNTVPIAVGVTAGIILLALTAVILSVIIIVVFLKRKRKLRSGGFVQLMSTEVET
jgi:subtilisin-like proprotein convertase family protein